MYGNVDWKTGDEVTNDFRGTICSDKPYRVPFVTLFSYGFYPLTAATRQLV